MSAPVEAGAAAVRASHSASLWSCRAQDTAEHVQREVLEGGADLVLHVGDISYVRAQAAALNHGSMVA